MVIEKNMLIVVLLCVITLLTCGIVVERQDRLFKANAAVEKQIAGIQKTCQLKPSR